MLSLALDPLDQARHLVQLAGKPAPLSVELLKGGKNNRVFEGWLETGERVILKSYFTDKRDYRNRLAAEWNFLTYAWERGLHIVPEPLAQDAEQSCGLYSFIEGYKLTPATLTKMHIDRAADFIIALNAQPRSFDRTPASEACFSLADHITTVKNRVQHLTNLDPEAPYVQDAETFVAQSLMPAFEQIEAHVRTQAAKLSLDETSHLPEADIILSPSDFGFHNALFNGEMLSFLDFEYAGCDDPAKLVCDFFCQPEIPVPVAYFEAFVAQLIVGLGLAAFHLERCHLLLDLYRVKWACIILNDFLPVGAARRQFATASAWEERCAVQLEKARHSIDTINLRN